MAKPLTGIKQNAQTEQEREAQSLQELSHSVVQHKAALEQTLLLLEQLHDSGALEMLTALTSAREKLAQVALTQVSQPAVTNTIQNVRQAAGVLGQLDPDVSKKVFESIMHGIERAGDALERQERVGVLDLLTALKDPGINRAVTALLNFLKGMGEKL